MLLKPLGEGTGFLKAGFLGFPKSGKTYTAALLAVAVRRTFGLEGAVAMVDTENGAEYIAPMVEALTGLSLHGIKTRSFDELCQVTAEVDKAAGNEVSVLIVDSVTHLWRNLCDSYLDAKNETRRKYHKKGQSGLEFQDWGIVKGQWNRRWADWFLNSPAHVIVCGRAGYEYDFQENDDGKRELVKTGTKMKVETEFGFEPSLLVEMERERSEGGWLRTATVNGDRFAVLDGLQARFRSHRLEGADGIPEPDYEADLERVARFFQPHLSRLKAGAHSVVTEQRSHITVEDEEEGRRRKRQADILCEEIQGELLRVHPSQGAADKQGRLDLMERNFGTRSWTRITSLRVEELKVGLLRLRRETLENGGGPDGPAPADGDDPAPPATFQEALGGSPPEERHDNDKAPPEPEGDPVDAIPDPPKRKGLKARREAILEAFRQMNYPEPIDILNRAGVKDVGKASAAELDALEKELSNHPARVG